LTLLSRELREALKDYKYLLNRGYSREVALNVISSRYFLDELQRLLLYRCVHSEEEISQVRKKMTQEKEVVIDGFNVAITLLNVLDNDMAFLCDDGLIRDLGLGKKKGDSRVLDMLILFSEYCEWKGIGFEILLDSQVSHSGEIANELRRRGIRALTTTKTDKEVILRNKAVVSNDFVVAMKSKMIANLLFDFLKDSNIPLVEISSLLS